MQARDSRHVPGVRVPAPALTPRVAVVPLPQRRPCHRVVFVDTEKSASSLKNWRTSSAVRLRLSSRFISCTLPREMKYMARLTQPATTTNSPGRYTSGSSEVAIAAIIFVFTSAS